MADEARDNSRPAATTSYDRRAIEYRSYGETLLRTLMVEAALAHDFASATERVPGSAGSIRKRQAEHFNDGQSEQSTQRLYRR